MFFIWISWKFSALMLFYRTFKYIFLDSKASIRIMSDTWNRVHKVHSNSEKLFVKHTKMLCHLLSTTVLLLILDTKHKLTLRYYRQAYGNHRRPNCLSRYFLKKSCNMVISFWGFVSIIVFGRFFNLVFTSQAQDVF